MNWDVCYKRAVLKDGTLLFPKKLSQEFLDQARKDMGSYLFANQYQNEIIPLEDQTFKEEWKRYWKDLPEQLYHFCFVDPAISEADTADYTAFVIVAVDVQKNWYIKHAVRMKCSPTFTIDYMFKLHQKFNCQVIGVEDVAYQKALIHFTIEEMRRRGVVLPVQGVKRGPTMSKEMRILGLVPRFEFSMLFLGPGQTDLENEMTHFPRGSHDDLLDSLSSINEIVYYPTQKRSRNEQPHPNSPEYESWIINNAHRGRSRGD
jgi:predicted phage terminase large subunit-like protein